MISFALYFKALTAVILKDGTLYLELLLMDLRVVMDLDHGVAVLLLAQAGHDPVHGCPDVGVDLRHAVHVTVKLHLASALTSSSPA